MLSLCELRRAAGLVKGRLLGARLVRSVQLDRFELVLVFETGGRGTPRAKQALLLSCRPRLGRLSLVEEIPPAPRALQSLPQFLRAHLVGSRLEGVGVAAADRILRLHFAGGEEAWELLLALMGGRSNIYLLDGEGRLRMALRPFEATRRDLAVGEAWRDPEPRDRAEGEDRFASVCDQDFFRELERAAASEQGADVSRELLGTLRRALRRRVRSLERKVELLAGDLAAAEEAAALERAGELLKSNLHRVARRQSELRVEDPQTGESVEIPLDPARSPSANLEDLFRRYRKALRRAARAGEEADAARERLEAMGALAGELEDLARARDQAALRSFAERPEVARLLARSRSGGDARSPRPETRRWGPPGVPARLLPKRYRSSTGLEIWVGKSDAGNDYLSTRLARGNDLFFHLEGSPGSHVVLRTEGRSDPPSEAVLEACELAVHFSKQRGGSRASVHVVPIKQVRKPARAKPGLVMVYGGRTVQLRHQPQRLRRILEARIPDEDSR